MSQRGWGHPHPCSRQGDWARQTPFSHHHPQTTLPSPSLASIKRAQHQAQSEKHSAGSWAMLEVRMGHEDRAELFLLEVSRAGTRTNLQAPSSSAILPSPTTTTITTSTGAVSITCACYETTAKTYSVLQPKARQNPQHPAATPSSVTASSAWPCQGQGSTFTFPLSRAEFCVRCCG